MSDSKIPTADDAPGPVDRVTAPQWRCICAGQGGSAYSSGCPVHDPHVDTDDTAWRSMYYGHLAAQQRIKERLGW